jgi:hypothetical protein
MAWYLSLQVSAAGAPHSPWRPAQLDSPAIACSPTCVAGCICFCLQMALLVPVLMSVVWTGPAHAAKKSRQVRTDRATHACAHLLHLWPFHYSSQHAR